MGDQGNDGAKRKHYKPPLVVRKSASEIRKELEEIDKLPLPRHLADKSPGYFAAIARRAAQAVVSRLPEGEPPSPLVRSALQDDLLKTRSPKRTTGDEIMGPPTKRASNFKRNHNSTVD
jgi:hypothetical protein